MEGWLGAAAGSCGHSSCDDDAPVVRGAWQAGSWPLGQRSRRRGVTGPGRYDDNGVTDAAKRKEGRKERPRATNYNAIVVGL